MSVEVRTCRVALYCDLLDHATSLGALINIRHSLRPPKLPKRAASDLKHPSSTEILHKLERLLAS